MPDKKEGLRIAAKVRNRLIAVVVLLVVCGCAVVAVANSSYTVNLIADGATQTVKTSEKDVDTLLSEQGIQVGSKDKVDTSSFKVGGSADNGNAITVYRTKTVTVSDNGESKEVTAAGLVQDALDAAGLSAVRDEDTVNYDLDTELVDNMKITVKRAPTITIKVDGKSIEVPSVTGTIADILDAAGIELGQYDNVSPKQTSAAKAGQTVEVERVFYTRRTAAETIKYETKYVKNADLTEGKKNVLQKGENGTKVVVYRDKYVDGEKDSTETVVETVVKEATDKIVEVGTKTKESAAALTNGTSDLSSAVATMHGSSTAYTAATGARCSTGVVAQRGYVAVDPNEIPYGTKMYIVADDGSVYGECIAADTGGFTQNSSTLVDLYMDTEDECIQWGRRDVTIYILEWGNGTVS